MQRDLYAGLVKKRHKQRINVSILQLNGRITYEALMDEVFFGYRQRRIVLMTNTAGQDPRLPRLPADIIVHQPHFQYRLLPLICQDIDTFAAMQAVCSSPGSPFTVHDRIDPRELTFRFHVHAGGALGSSLSSLNANRAQISAFFEPFLSEAERQTPLAARRMPIAGVEFQGLLYKKGKISAPPAAAQQVSTTGSSPSSSPPGIDNAPTRTTYITAAALVTTHESLSESGIAQRALMCSFFDSPLLDTLASNTDTIRNVRGSKNRYHVMAVKRPVGTAATPLAPGGALGKSRKGASAGEGASCSSATTMRPALDELSMTSRRSLLEQARAKNLLVYEKVAEGQYRYAC